MESGVCKSDLNRRSWFVWIAYVCVCCVCMCVIQCECSDHTDYGYILSTCSTCIFLCSVFAGLSFLKLRFKVASVHSIYIRIMIST